MNLGTILFLHSRIANAAWLYMIILGVWSFINYVRGRGVDGGLYPYRSGAEVFDRMIPGASDLQVGRF